jgi:hypothetical protein
MAASGVGHLHFIAGRMNKHVDINILLSTSDSQCRKTGVHENFAFHHENDPKYSSHLVKGWCFYNCSKIILGNYRST